MSKKVFDRLAEGLEEARSIAAGDIPAAGLFIDGHRYVPMEEYVRLRSERDELNRECQASMGEIARLRNELQEARNKAIEDAAVLLDAEAAKLVVGELPHGVAVGLAAAIRQLKEEKP